MVHSEVSTHVPSDSQKLAEDRITDARALFNEGRYDAAFYLAGYAVECALKACIAKLTRHYQFPLSPESSRDIYSHDFRRLLRAASLTDRFEQAMLATPKLEEYWNGVVKDWSEKAATIGVVDVVRSKPRTCSAP